MINNLNDQQLDKLYGMIARGIDHLHTQSETGDGGRARTLFYALAAFLDERGVIDHLKAASMYRLSLELAAEAEAMRDTDNEFLESCGIQFDQQASN